MEQQNRPSAVGNLVISEEVIASIAVNAVRDAEGVGSFAPHPTDLYSLLRPNEPYKSVRVFATDSEIRIHLYLNLKSGVKIPAVCEAVQNAVKSAVQSMTGRVVTKVDISIVGIDPAEQEKAQ